MPGVEVPPERVRPASRLVGLPPLLGLAATLVALCWLRLLGAAGMPWRLAFLFGGLLASGAAITRCPCSPWVLGLAALTALLAGAGLDPAWDSIRLVVLILAVLATLAALLLLLPAVVRRIFVSLLIVVHFGGIATAVMTVPPTPWLANVVWSRFYRPYLEFMYLNNAYHFYAPEPGPATLAWFYVKYEDGSAQWVEIPRRDSHALALQYQRRLSLTESINQLLAPPAVL